MHAHRVEVLDATDHDAVVGGVTHDLELVLLPSRDRALDEDLVDGRRGDALGRQPAQGRLVMRDARARAAQDVARPDDDRPTNGGGDLEGLVDVVREARFGHRQSDIGHGGLEQFAVLGRRDGLGTRADHLDPESLGHPATHQLHGQVERRLTAEGRQ